MLSVDEVTEIPAVFILLVMDQYPFDHRIRQPLPRLPFAVLNSAEGKNSWQLPLSCGGALSWMTRIDSSLLGKQKVRSLGSLKRGKN